MGESTAEDGEGEASANGGGFNFGLTDGSGELEGDDEEAEEEAEAEQAEDDAAEETADAEEIDEESEKITGEGAELDNPDDEGSTEGKEQASPNAMAAAADFTEDDDPTEEDGVAAEDDPLDDPSESGESGSGEDGDPVDFSGDKSVDFAGDERATSNGSQPGNHAQSNSSGSDGENGQLYDIDPVQDSQKAFNFAEKQSKAAYEFAYKEATQNPLTRLIQKYTSEKVRKRLDQVFSRKMLGSVLIGMSFTNIIVVSIDAAIGRPGVRWWEPFLWMFVFSTAVFIFVWWERLARKATEAANQAAESATDAAESASEKAEAASEAASQAAESASKTAEAASEAATGGDTESDLNAATKSTPTTLNGEGQTAGATHAPARRRAPDRRPNKRFASDSTTQKRLTTFDSGSDSGYDSTASEFDGDQFDEDSKFEGIDVTEFSGRGGFKNPGNAEDL